MIKDSFKKEGNKYIVFPEIKKFCKNNEIDLPSNRVDGLCSIESFADKNSINAEKVNEWLEKIIKEGIKHIYISKVSFFKDKSLYKSELFWREFTNRFNIENIFVNNDAGTNKLKYKSIKFTKINSSISVVHLYMSMLVAQPEPDHESGDIELYPVFIDIDIEKEIVIIRIKSKSNQYKTKSGITFKQKVDFNNKITNDKIVKEIIDKLAIDIGFNRYQFDEFKDEIEFAYYSLLKEMTSTPKIIEEKLEGCKGIIENTISNLLKTLGISEQHYRDAATADLRILLEKFTAISYPDKDIFTENSFAFPVKLSATDSEDTKIEESSSNYEPLQTKGAFYDHKKIIMAEEVCDGMRIAVKRLDKKYYGAEPFIAKLDYIKGFARIRIEEYVEEEDIQNVLSRVISYI